MRVFFYIFCIHDEEKKPTQSVISHNAWQKLAMPVVSISIPANAHQHSSSPKNTSEIRTNLASVIFRVHIDKITKS